jgi:hypothetical protein
MTSKQVNEFIGSLPQGVEAKAGVSYAGETTTTSIDLESDGWKMFTDRLSQPALFASDHLFFKGVVSWKIVKNSGSCP